ncbi:DUF5336 domain-containing protein [Catenulispora sp. NL8]|uniref:DUF5336 domain-containing protein n=1 Tax=Catenulispora pinistramenti TaxID=2705254 RepID=A0ABS5KMT3_9ACTN|nr:DUF5336 domain-containing protein [Catenulispora pinistramenti]MBS2547365.1 DUF5336 domain-containing protein [Catenulispora pinistramenti]
MSTPTGANGDSVPHPGPSQSPVPEGPNQPASPLPQPAPQPSHQAAPQPPNQAAPQPPHQLAPGYQGSPSGGDHAHPPHPHQPPPRAAVTVPLGKMLYLCVAALGVINLFLGYVSAGDGDSANLYKAAVAIYALAPTMFFLAGLVAVRGFLPGERAPGVLPAMITTAVFVTLVLSAISSSGAGDLQTLFLVFGAVQFILAWLAYLFDAGVIAARR